MPKNYHPAEQEGWLDRLRAGAFKNLSGVKKSLGRIHWSPKDKERALQLAESYFENPALVANERFYPGTKVSAPEAPAPAETKKVEPVKKTLVKAPSPERIEGEVQDIERMMAIATSGMNALVGSYGNSLEAAAPPDVQVFRNNISLLGRKLNQTLRARYPEAAPKMKPARKEEPAPPPPPPPPALNGKQVMAPAENLPSGIMV